MLMRGAYGDGIRIRLAGIRVKVTVKHSDGRDSGTGTAPRMISFRSSFRHIPRRIPFQYRSMKVVPVPVRQDNYAYLLIDDSTNKAAAIDPYDVSKVLAAADAHNVEIVAGITTHHHYDHSGGNEVCCFYSDLFDLS